MNVNELIEQLRKLPKEVREQPIMDGKPNVGYRLRNFSRQGHCIRRRRLQRVRPGAFRRGKRNRVGKPI